MHHQPADHSSSSWIVTRPITSQIWHKQLLLKEWSCFACLPTQHTYFSLLTTVPLDPSRDNGERSAIDSAPTTQEKSWIGTINVSSIFNSAWLKGMSMSNIIASFCAAGFFPLNRKAVLSQLTGTCSFTPWPATCLLAFCAFQYSLTDRPLNITPDWRFAYRGSAHVVQHPAKHTTKPCSEQRQLATHLLFCPVIPP